MHTIDKFYLHHKADETVSILFKIALPFKYPCRSVPINMQLQVDISLYHLFWHLTSCCIFDIHGAYELNPPFSLVKHLWESQYAEFIEIAKSWNFNIQSRVAACNLNYLFQFYLKQCFQLYSASSLQVVLFHIFSYCTVSWYFLKLSVSTNSNKFIALSMLSLSSSRYWFSSTSLYCCELMCCLLSKHLIDNLYAYLKAFRSTQVSFVVFLSFSQNFLLNKKNIWIYSFIYCVLAVW